MEQRTAIIGVGNTITFAATAGAHAVLDHELAPGHASLPPHVHGHEGEAIYMLERRLLVRIAETERVVGQGEFVWLPRLIAHAVSNPRPEPAQFLLLFTPGGFEQCFYDLEATLGGSSVFCREPSTPLWRARRGRGGYGGARRPSARGSVTRHAGPQPEDGSRAEPRDWA
jgi:mannose-6-phosphate isomerase-like protein (cupin superfamily)